MSNSTPIRVGIAGLGRSGWNIHAKLLEQLNEQYQVVAVVDNEAARREEAIDRFDCAAYATYEELLADPAVELIVLALPSFVHADYSIAALNAGKHVVCEKPMAASLADADRMVAAAAQSEPILTIFQNRRYDPYFQKVNELLAEGVLGRILQIRITASNFGRRWDWQTLKQYGGGNLNNTGPHFIDQALQFFGDHEITQIFCHMDRALTLGDADDHVKLVFKGDDTPTVDIEISSAMAYPGEFINIAGTKGGLAGSAQELRWRVIDEAALPPRTLEMTPTPDRSYNRDAIPWLEHSWRAADHDHPGYGAYYQDLFQTIRHGAPLAVTAEDVRRVIWLLEECRRISPV
ncbi:MAG: Gfo/Idh/MocA family oxidoreductase [Caldilineaceae bacterium]|nr:Gfo/Idh/MocA family oxidoreductase [Caldilineaceae bacterium]